MSREELLAPEIYNFVSEIEKFAQNKERLALRWENENGDKQEITYSHLLQQANKVGNVFKAAGLKKGMLY